MVTRTTGEDRSICGDVLSCATRTRIAIQNCNPISRRRPRIPASPAACPCRTAALENIRLSAQVHTPHASRFIGVGEASFQKLSPIPQQLFPVLAVNAPPVVIHRLPRLRLILPATASTGPVPKHSSEPWLVAAPSACRCCDIPCPSLLR